MKELTIYTDGACSGNPGPGGWGAILTNGSKTIEMSGGVHHTTNNKMELTAVISALEALKESCKINLYTDSQYIVNAINEGWLSNWKQRGWSRREGEIKNLVLWQRLNRQLDFHEVTFNWVKAHEGNEYNNRCDRLAVMECQGFKNKIEE